MENPFEMIIQRLDNIEKLLNELTKREISGNQTPSSDEIMTVDQVADYLSLAKPTIYGKCASREIPCFKVGKRNYFMKQDINEWLKTGRRATNYEIQQQAAEYIRKHPFKR